MFGFLRRFWLPLVLIVVMAAGGWAVVRVRDTFAFDGVVHSGELNAQTPQTFNPKRVVYEITGTAGDGASINYLDENGQPNLVDQARLPWEYTIVTTLPSMSANIVAQATGSRGSLRCRVIVDGNVRDDRQITEDTPFIYCLVKSV